MKTLNSYHLVRLCLSALIILSLGTPFSSTAFDSNGYLCNPSGQAATAEAETKLKDFLIAVGDIQPNDSPDPADHCSDCLVSPVALSATAVQLPTPSFSRLQNAQSKFDKGDIRTQRGPPLGVRAPPHFL